MFSLQGKVVLITGAANGIGAVVLQHILEEGPKHVRILDLDVELGVQLQGDLNQKYGQQKVKFVKCDVSNDDELFGAFDDTIQELGYIDVVVNNAGIARDNDSKGRRKTIEVNLIGTINSTIKAVELMRKDKGGKGGTIINISSIAALLKLNTMSLAYSASKSGVLQFSYCIGNEPFHSKTGVRVMTICYGATGTKILEGLVLYDEDESITDILDANPSQTTESAAKGTIEVFKTGQSGSVWIIKDNKPAKDITEPLSKLYSEMENLVYGN